MTPKWRSLNDSPLKRSLRTKTPKFGSLKRKNSGREDAATSQKFRNLHTIFVAFLQPFGGSEGGDGGAFPGVGGSAAQPTWNHPYKKKDMEIWYFPRISMGRTSWAKNVSFWEGKKCKNPSLLGVGDFSNSTGMASQRHLGCWGCCHSQGF